MVKDLTREVPRSPYEKLDGIPWLPRLIDKVRAMKAGKLGDYTPYPCGGDRHFLGTLGLDADALKAEIDADKDDAAILAWVKTQLPADAEARLAAYSEQASTPVTGEMAGWLEEAKKAVAAARPELDLDGVKTFGQLICVEEGHPLP
jgi:hypothetical protein